MSGPPPSRPASRAAHRQTPLPPAQGGTQASRKAHTRSSTPVAGFGRGPTPGPEQHAQHTQHAHHTQPPQQITDAHLHAHQLHSHPEQGVPHARSNGQPASVQPHLPFAFRAPTAYRPGYAQGHPIHFEFGNGQSPARASTRADSDISAFGKLYARRQQPPEEHDNAHAREETHDNNRMAASRRSVGDHAPAEVQAQKEHEGEDPDEEEEQVETASRQDRRPSHLPSAESIAKETERNVAQYKQQTPSSQPLPAAETDPTRIAPKAPMNEHQTPHPYPEAFARPTASAAGLQTPTKKGRSAHFDGARHDRSSTTPTFKPPPRHIVNAAVTPRNSKSASAPDAETKRPSTFATRVATSGNASDSTASFGTRASEDCPADTAASASNRYSKSGGRPSHHTDLSQENEQAKCVPDANAADTDAAEAAMSPDGLARHMHTHLPPTSATHAPALPTQHPEVSPSAQPPSIGTSRPASRSGTDDQIVHAAPQILQAHRQHAQHLHQDAATETFIETAIPRTHSDAHLQRSLLGPSQVVSASPDSPYESACGPPRIHNRTDESDDTMTPSDHLFFARYPDEPWPADGSHCSAQQPPQQSQTIVTMRMVGEQQMRRANALHRDEEHLEHADQQSFTDMDIDAVSNAIRREEDHIYDDAETEFAQERAEDRPLSSLPVSSMDSSVPGHEATQRAPVNTIGESHARQPDHIARAYKHQSQPARSLETPPAKQPIAHIDSVESPLSIFPVQLIDEISKLAVLRGLPPPRMSFEAEDQCSKEDKVAVRLELNYLAPVFDRDDNCRALQGHDTHRDDYDTNAAAECPTGQGSQYEDKGDDDAAHPREMDTGIRSASDPYDHHQDIADPFDLGPGAPRSDPEAYWETDGQDTSQRDSFHEPSRHDSVEPEPEPIAPGRFELILHAQSVSRDLEVEVMSYIMLFDEPGRDNQAGVVALIEELSYIVSLVRGQGKIRYRKQLPEKPCLPKLKLFTQKEDGSWKAVKQFFPLPFSTAPPQWNEAIRELGQWKLKGAYRERWMVQEDVRVAQAVANANKEGFKRLKTASKRADAAYTKFRKLLDDRRIEQQEYEDELQAVIKERRKTCPVTAAMSARV